MYSPFCIALTRITYLLYVLEFVLSLMQIRAVSALKHPNIIKLYGTALKDHHMYIALGAHKLYNSDIKIQR